MPITATMVPIYGLARTLGLRNSYVGLILVGLLVLFTLLNRRARAALNSYDPLIAAVVAGQSVASLLIDQFGWVVFREHHISPGRVVGMALVASGVALPE